MIKCSAGMKRSGSLNVWPIEGVPDHVCSALVVGE